MMKWLNQKPATPLALIYTESFHLLHSQIDRVPLEGKDRLAMSNDVGDVLPGSPPEGLEWRTKKALDNILGFAVVEAKRVGYEVKIITDDSKWGGKIDRSEFKRCIDMLDAGRAQALITYSEMLPSSLQSGGVPSKELMERAKKNNWRVILINLFTNPEISHCYWQPEYIHLTKDDRSDGVIVFVRPPLLEDSILEGLPTL